MRLAQRTTSLDDASYTQQDHFKYDTKMTPPSSLTWLIKDAPHLELRRLRESGALKALLPEVDRLYGVPQNPKHHPEVCTGWHTELCLERAEALGLGFSGRYAVLVHDLGKALTPAAVLPQHIDHENAGVEPVNAVNLRLNVDEFSANAALQVCKHHLRFHKAFVMRSKSVLSLLVESEVEASPALRETVLGACKADAQGRLGMQARPYYQADFFREVCVRLEAFPPLPLLEQQTKDWQVRHNERLSVVRATALRFKQMHQESQQDVD